MIYKHFKGDYYQVLGTALDTITGEEVVVYRPLYKCDIHLFTRPKEEFFDTITKEGKTFYRFKQVDYENIPKNIKAFYDIPFAFTI